MAKLQRLVIEQQSDVLVRSGTKEYHLLLDWDNDYHMAFGMNVLSPETVKQALSEAVEAIHILQNNGNI